MGSRGEKAPHSLYMPHREKPFLMNVGSAVQTLSKQPEKGLGWCWDSGPLSGRWLSRGMSSKLWGLSKQTDSCAVHIPLPES